MKIALKVVRDIWGTLWDQISDGSAECYVYTASILGG